MSALVEGVVIGLGAAGSAAAGLRWLRVAQREHYLAGSTTRFAVRWWKIRWQSATLLGLGVAALVVAFWVPSAAIARMCRMFPGLVVSLGFTVTRWLTTNRFFSSQLSATLGSMTTLILLPLMRSTSSVPL